MDERDEPAPGRIIVLLGLVALQPEGSHVRRTWLDERSSAIYHLVVAADPSGLHRLEHLEIWARHAGAAARMLPLLSTGPTHVTGPTHAVSEIGRHPAAMELQRALPARLAG